MSFLPKEYERFIENLTSKEEKENFYKQKTDKDKYKFLKDLVRKNEKDKIRQAIILFSFLDECKEYEKEEENKEKKGIGKLNLELEKSFIYHAILIYYFLNEEEKLCQFFSNRLLRKEITEEEKKSILKEIKTYNKETNLLSFLEYLKKSLGKT